MIPRVSSGSSTRCTPTDQRRVTFNNEVRIRYFETSPPQSTPYAQRLQHKLKAQPAAPRLIERPVVPPRIKPRYTLTQRLLRGSPDMALVAVVGSVVAISVAGPFGLIVPASCLLIAGCMYLYRRSTVVKPEKLQAKRAVKEQLLYQARQANFHGDYEKAKTYKKLAQKLK